MDKCTIRVYNFDISFEHLTSFQLRHWDDREKNGAGLP